MPTRELLPPGYEDPILIEDAPSLPTHLPINEQPREAREAAFERFAPVGGTLGAGASRGVATALGGLGYELEALSSQIPWAGKKIKPYFKRWGDWFKETSDNIPQVIRGISDVEWKEPRDVGGLVLESVGQVLGYLGPAAAFTILTGGTTAGAMGKPVADKAAGYLARTFGKAVADPRFARTFLFTGATEAGNVYSSIRDLTGLEKPWLSQLVGAINGTLEAVPLINNLDNVFGKLTQDAKKKFLRNYMSDVLDTTVSASVSEGVTEGMQEVTSALAEKFAADNWNIDSRDLLRVTDAFVAGAIGGGLLAGAGRAVVRPFVGTAEEPQRRTTPPLTTLPQFTRPETGMQQPPFGGAIPPDAPATTPGVFGPQVPSYEEAMLGRGPGAMAEIPFATPAPAAEAAGAVAQEAAAGAAVANALAVDGPAAQVAEDPTVPAKPPEAAMPNVGLPVKTAPTADERVEAVLRDAISRMPSVPPPEVQDQMRVAIRDELSKPAQSIPEEKEPRKTKQPNLGKVAESAAAATGASLRKRDRKDRTKPVAAVQPQQEQGQAPQPGNIPQPVSGQETRAGGGVLQAPVAPPVSPQPPVSPVVETITPTESEVTQRGQEVQEGEKVKPKPVAAPAAPAPAPKPKQQVRKIKSGSFTAAVAGVLQRLQNDVKAARNDAELAAVRERFDAEMAELSKPGSQAGVLTTQEKQILHNAGIAANGYFSVRSKAIEENGLPINAETSFMVDRNGNQSPVWVRRVTVGGKTRIQIHADFNGAPSPRPIYYTDPEIVQGLDKITDENGNELTGNRAVYEFIKREENQVPDKWDKPRGGGGGLEFLRNSKYLFRKSKLDWLYQLINYVSKTGPEGHATLAKSITENIKDKSEAELESIADLLSKYLVWRADIQSVSESAKQLVKLLSGDSKYGDKEVDNGLWNTLTEKIPPILKAVEAKTPTAPQENQAERNELIRWISAAVQGRDATGLSHNDLLVLTNSGLKVIRDTLLGLANLDPAKSAETLADDVIDLQGKAAELLINASGIRKEYLQKIHDHAGSVVDNLLPGDVRDKVHPPTMGMDYSAPQPSLASQAKPTFDPINAPEVQSAAGENITVLLEDPRYGFSKEVIDTWKLFLGHMKNMPGMLDSLNLRVVVGKGGQLEVSGSYDRVNRLITLMARNAGSDTMPHEAAHHIYELLPQDMRDQNEAAWHVALRKVVDKEQDPKLKRQLEMVLHSGGKLPEVFVGMPGAGDAITVTAADGQTFKATNLGYAANQMGKVVPVVRLDEDVPGVADAGEWYYVSRLVEKGYMVSGILGPYMNQAQRDVVDRYYHLNNPGEYFVAGFTKRYAPTGVLQQIHAYALRIFDAIMDVLAKTGLLTNDVFRKVRADLASGEYHRKGTKRYVDESTDFEEPKRGDIAYQFAFNRGMVEKNVKAQAENEEQAGLEAGTAMFQNRALANELGAASLAVQMRGDTVTKRAERLSGLTDTTEAAGAARSFGATYNRVANILTDPNASEETKNQYALDFWKIINHYRSKLERLGTGLVTTTEKLNKLLSSERIQKMPELQAEAERQREVVAGGIEKFVRQYVKVLQASLREESRTQGETEAIARELAFYEKFDRETGREAKVMRVSHVLDVLSLTPEGRNLIYGTGPVTSKQVADVYNATAEALQIEGARNSMLVDEDGSPVFDSKFVDKLSQKINLLENVRRDGGLDPIFSMVSRMGELSRRLAAINMLGETARMHSDFYHAYEQEYSKWYDQMQRNPSAAIARMMRSMGNARKREGYIMHVIAQRNREVAAAAQQVYDQGIAYEMLGSALSDPGIQATERLANERVQAVPQWVVEKYGDGLNEADLPVLPDKENGNRPFMHIPLPDGSVHRMSLDVASADSDQQMEQTYEAMNKLTDWLNSNEGMSHPNRQFYQRISQIMDSVYMGKLLHTVNPFTQLIWSAGNLPIHLARDTQLKLANLLGIKLKDLDEVSQKLHKTWAPVWKGKCQSAALQAMRSHKELALGANETSYLKRVHDRAIDSEAARLRRYMNEVWPHVAGYANHVKRAPKVGEEIAPGMVATQQDLDCLNMQVQAFDALYQMLAELSKGRASMTIQRVMDEYSGGKKVVRAPLKLHAYMLPASFSANGVLFASNWVSEVGSTVDDKEPINYSRAVQIMDSHFDDFVMPFLLFSGTYSDHALFDSEYLLEAYRKVKDGSIRNMDELSDFMLADGTTSFEGRLQTKRALATMFHRDVMNVVSTVQPSSTTSIQSQDVIINTSHNSFNTARHGPVAGYSFYTYGAITEGQWYKMVADAMQRNIKVVVDTMEATVFEIDRELKHLSEKRLMNAEELKRHKQLETIKNSFQSVIVDVRQMMSSGGGNDNQKFIQSVSEEGRAVERAFNYTISSALAGMVTALNNSVGNYQRYMMMHSMLHGAMRTASPTLHWVFVKNFIKMFPLLARGGAIGIAKGIKAGYMAKKGTKRLEALAAIVDEVANQTWLRDMNFGLFKINNEDNRKLRDLGVFPYVNPYHLGMVLELAATGGKTYNPAFSTDPSTASMQKLLSSTASYLGVFLVDSVGTIFPRVFDMSSNSAMMNLASHMNQAMKKQALATWKAMGPKLAIEYNLNNPKALGNNVRPEYYMQDGANDTQKSHLVDLFRAFNSHPDEVVIEYWRKLSETPEEQWKDVPFTTPQLDADLGKAVAAELNIAMVSNRPVKLQANQKLRMIFAIMGWPWMAANQSVRWFTRVAKDSTNHARSAMLAQQVMTAMTLLLVAGMTTLLNWGVLRWLYPWWYGEESRVKMPWDYDTGAGAAKRMIVAMSSAAPVLNIFPNLMFNDSPHAASAGIDMFIQSKIKDVISYVGKSSSSGNWMAYLPELTKRTFPAMRGVVNRIPGYSGVVEVNNAGVLLQRYAPEEILRPPSGGSGFASGITPLSPYSRALVDAAMNGDWVLFDQTYAEAVEVARGMGRPEPERLVQQLYESRNPSRLAFRTAPTAEQINNIMDKMSDGERVRFQDTMARFAMGSRRMGGRSNIARRVEIPIESWLEQPQLETAAAEQATAAQQTQTIPSTALPAAFSAPRLSLGRSTRRVAASRRGSRKPFSLGIPAVRKSRSAAGRRYSSRSLRLPRLRI